MLFTIPAICLSTISGTASFAQESLSPNIREYSYMVIGSINILIGIMTTIQQYLKISELNESYRVASIAWDKFSRNIKVELAKSPKQRMECNTFFKMHRQEFDRLMETSPSIPQYIVREFMRTFQGRTGSTEREHFDKLKKPDICNIIESVNENRKNWYEDDTDDKSGDPQQNKETISKSSSETSFDLVNRYIRKHGSISSAGSLDSDVSIFRDKMEELTNMIRFKKIKDFIARFESENERKPFKSEIMENLKDRISHSTLQQFFKTCMDEYVDSDRESV
jgi:hypothetical protein